METGSIRRSLVEYAHSAGSTLECSLHFTQSSSRFVSSIGISTGSSGYVCDILHLLNGRAEAGEVFVQTAQVGRIDLSFFKHLIQRSGSGASAVASTQVDGCRFLEFHTLTISLHVWV